MPIYYYIRMMASLSLRQLWNLKNCSISFSKCYFYKRLYQTSSSLRQFSDVNPYNIDDVLKIEETGTSSDLQPAINLSDQELETMFAKNIYNTETWRMVIRYKARTAFLNKYPTANSLKELDDSLSVAARKILETSGYSMENSAESNKSELIKLREQEMVPIEEGKVGNYPFAPADIEKRRDRLMTHRSVLTDVNIIREEMGNEIIPETPVSFSTDHLNSKTKPKSSGEKYEEIILEEPGQFRLSREEIEKRKTNEWKIFYGKPNPKIPVSKVPCGGCGAHLHCQDSALVGYLPSEVFTQMSEFELSEVLCQRCNFLKDYNIALNLSVPPETYPNIIENIKKKRALILLMVDLLDFPCSIWPGIIDLVGPKQPILVIGNKVDLLPMDETNYLDNIKASLSHSLKEMNVDRGLNIRKICLISAKTGFGVEDLISEIMTNWGNSGDIYLIGCTNVGKSSLFNALLQSDLCKQRARDIIHRATVSIWPGTTLNLLKFPVMRTSEIRLKMRQRRLDFWSYRLNQERKLRKFQLKSTGNSRYAQLIGHVGVTFGNPTLQIGSGGSEEPFKLESGIREDSKKLESFDPESYYFRSGKWFFDTPGSVHNDQIINLLTMEELSWTLVKHYSSPRCFILKTHHTLFLAGLGRIDYIDGAKSMKAMVFSSPELPISIMKTEHADEFYQKYLGTNVLKVPFGNEERLKDFPKLISKEFTIFGDGHKVCSADIILSSAGWVSFCYESDMIAKVLAYTPDGRGCHIRDPPLLKKAIQLRGKRIGRTPACEPSLVNYQMLRRHVKRV